MEGRKPYGVAAWSGEEVAKAKGYVFIYTEKDKTSRLVFRYHVYEDWAANRNMDVNPKVGEREGNVKDVTLDMHSEFLLSFKAERCFFTLDVDDFCSFADSEQCRSV